MSAGWSAAYNGEIPVCKQQKRPGSLMLRPFLFALFEFGKESLEERKQFTIGFEFLLIDPMADWIRLKHLVGFDELAYPFSGMAKDSCGDSGEDGSPQDACFGDPWPHKGNTENVSLELKPLVRFRSAPGSDKLRRIHSKFFQGMQAFGK